MSERPWPFYSVGAAVRWADRLLTTPPIGSQLGRLTGSEAGADELGTAQEVAMTVSVAVSNVGEGRLVRAVHGNGEVHMQDLAQRLASETWKGPEGGKTIALARVLATHILKDFRRRSQGRPKRTVKRAVSDMGTSRATYYRVWAETGADMRAAVDMWLRKGESELSERLSAVGIV